MRSLLLSLSACAAGALYAQSFQAHLGGMRHQDAVAVFQDASGLTTVVRDVTDAPAGVQVRLLRTDLSGGNATWSDVSLLPGAAFVQGAIADAGAFILCGSVVRNGRHDHDAFVVKVGPTGQVQWMWSTDDPLSEEQLLHLTRMTDGRYAAAGVRRAGADGNAYIAVLSSGGTEEWSMDYGDARDQQLDAVLADAQGLIGVGRVATGTRGRDAYVLRTDLTGAALWWQERGGTQDEVAVGIVPLTASTFAWVGWTETYGDTNMYGEHGRNILLMAQNTSGDSLWAAVFGDTLAHHQACTIAKAGNGDLLIGGKRYTGPDGSSLVVRTTATGTELWRRTYDVLGEEEVRAFAPAINNTGFVACGWCFGEEGGDVLLLRKTAAGD